MPVNLTHLLKQKFKKVTAGSNHVLGFTCSLKLMGWGDTSKSRLGNTETYEKRTYKVFQEGEEQESELHVTAYDLTRMLRHKKAPTKTVENEQVHASTTRRSVQSQPKLSMVQQQQEQAPIP